MNQTFTIRDANEGDFPKLIDLFQEFALFEKTPERMVNTVEKMKKEKSFFNGFVAVDENENVLGFATYFFSYHTWIGKSIYMDDLYVREQYRGLGLGKALLDKVVDFAKKEKCSKVRWQVSNWNTNAQEFYKKMGAQIDDVEINCDLTLNN
ncbi:MAG: GNAT family N-acetyltransferase [Bacteroidota bacterium]